MQRLSGKCPRLSHIIIMVIVSPLSLLWGEIFTSTLLPQNVDSRMNIFATDPTIGFTYKPKAKTYEKGQEYNVPYQINSLGLRDREYGAKEETVFRVLLLGDSFSVSHGLRIEDSLSRQMEKALQSLVDRDGKHVAIEVINAAVGGYSPYNYWKSYSRWAPVFKPDVVVVGLSPDDYDCGNENARYLIENGDILGLSTNGQQPERTGGISIKKLRKWLSWHSEFYILMRNFFYYNELVGRIVQWSSAGGVRDDSELKLYSAHQEETVAKTWSKAFFYLQNLRKAATADGIKLILIPIPLKMEIDSGQYRQVLATKGFRDEQMDLDQQLRTISAFCNGENISILDPRQAMQMRQAEVPCYFVYDGHWNVEGVRVAAVSLARQWYEMGLPPWGSTARKSDQL